MDKRIVHIIGQSHIDVAWFWPYYPETIYDCVKLTFTRAVDNLKMHDEYTFAQSQVPLYEAAEKYFPELFAEIMKYVKEGRWDIVGGMYVEAEGGEPCGESLVRQCLFGQRYFSKKFGVKVKVGWLPDSWTIPWQLPQILKKSGMDYLVFFRGAKGESLFWWEAPDGSRILACKPLRGFFGHRPFPNLEDLAFDISRRYGVKNIPMIIGSGDHGGGPTYQEIQNIKELKASLTPKIEIRFSTPHQFFEALSKEAEGLPVLKDELDWELVGDLTNCARLKQENNLSEVTLITAEKFSSIAMHFTGMPYPQAEFNTAWEKVLFNQFHDIIGGSIIPSAQEDAHKLYNEAIQTGGKVLGESLRSISSIIDTSDGGLNVIVFNSLSWNRTDLVDVELDLPDGWKEVKLLDPEGREVQVQIVERCEREGKVHLRLIFIVENVPSLGYKTYRVVPAEGGKCDVDSIKITEEEIENDFFKVRVSKTTGHVESIFDKENNIEVLDGNAKGNVLQLIEDLGDSEGRLIPGIDRSNKFIGHSWSIDSKTSLEVSERGPVRAKLTVRRASNNSTYMQEIVVYSKIKRIDFNLTVDWHEIHKALKVSFPLNITNPVLTAGIQYGDANRIPNGEEQPFQRWIDMSEADKTHGVALLSNSKYSYDARNNIVRLTLLRSPTEPAYNVDWGIHNIRYSIYPHKGDWRSSEVVQRSYEFNHPLIALVEKQHEGILRKVGSFLQVEPKNVIIDCVKKAEDDENLILRLYECTGVETEAEVTLNLNRSIKDAYKTNILEDKILEKIKVYENKLKFPLKPYEIATIKIVLK
jgi:alpha-mannosidase